MTTLSKLAGAGWAGKFVGGVQLAPEDLYLVKGGTLTITPPHHARRGPARTERRRRRLSVPERELDESEPDGSAAEVTNVDVLHTPPPPPKR